MKRLRNDLLQSAIMGFEQRRDKALRDVIRYQTKLDILKRRAKRLEKQNAKEKHSGERKASRCIRQEAASVPIADAGETTTVIERPEAPAQVPRDDLELPTFLRRGLEAQVAVNTVIDQHEEQKARYERFKEERREKNKLRAKQRKEERDVVKPSKFKDDKARSIPLTGRAALKFIKEGA